MLSPQYEKEFDALCRAVARACPDESFGCSWPCRGRCYEPDEGLLLVGPFAHGFGDHVRPAGARPVFGGKGARKRPYVPGRAQRVAEPDADVCPLGDWLARSRAGTTTFFQTARGLVDPRRSIDDWASWFAWTNVLKLVPVAASGGRSEGAPPAPVVDAQWDGAVALLVRELEELRPRHVLFLVGQTLARRLADEPALFAERPDVRLGAPGDVRQGTLGDGAAAYFAHHPAAARWRGVGAHALAKKLRAAIARRPGGATALGAPAKAAKTVAELGLPGMA